MRTIIQLVPQWWVTDKLLIAVAGSEAQEPFYGRAGVMVARAGYYKHVAPDGLLSPPAVSVPHSDAAIAGSESAQIGLRSLT